MKMMMTSYYFSTITILIFFPIFLDGKSLKECDYNHDIRTYFCKNIVDAFPDKFYGLYHLKCVNCNIKTFSNNTFPFENSLLSFNVSASGVRYITNNAFSKLHSIQYIYLQHNEIIDIYPEAFSGLRQVYELHLEHNEIVHLVPGFVRDLESNSIDLSFNRIKELPNGAFEGVSSILALDLSNNKIHKINSDSFIALQSLEVLNLGNNRICHLPFGIFKYSENLRQLNLADNKLTNFAVGAFSGLNGLNSLILANNSITNFDGHVLLPFNILTKLDISGNGIYYFDANSIKSSVPSLRVLRMDDNLFSCDLLINIVQYFKSVNIEVVSSSKRFDVQNINGIACVDVTVTGKIPLDAFLEAAKQDSKKYFIYC